MTVNSISDIYNDKSCMVIVYVYHPCVFDLQRWFQDAPLKYVAVALCAT